METCVWRRTSGQRHSGSNLKYFLLRRNWKKILSKMFVTSGSWSILNLWRTFAKIKESFWPLESNCSSHDLHKNFVSFGEKYFIKKKQGYDLTFSWIKMLVLRFVLIISEVLSLSELFLEIRPFSVDLLNR